MTSSLLSWKAYEFTKYKKGKLWFAIFGLLSAGFLVLAFQWKSFTMIVFLILAIFLIFIYALKEPRLLKITVTPLGIKINQKLHEFSQFDSFWIFYDPPEIKEISLKTRQILLPYLSIPLGKVDPNEVREILLKFLPEEKQKESILDNITRILRF